MTLQSEIAAHSDAFEMYFNAMPAAFAVLDKNLCFVEANAHHCDIVMTARDDLIGKFVFDVFPESEDREAIVREAFTTALHGERSCMPETGYAIPGEDGEMTEIFWRVHCVPIVPGVCFGIHSENVTKVVKERELREAIAGELQHRVNNILSVIAATARQTARSYSEMDDFMRAFQGRLESIQRTNALLTGGNWDGLTFAELLNRQLAQVANLIGKQIHIVGEDFRIAAKAAQTVSMALHELLTNAQKYGALSGDIGRLDIEFKPCPDDGFRVSWIESDLSDVKAPTRSGYGSTILKSLVPSQLGAVVVQKFTEDSHSYVICRNDPEGCSDQLE